MPGLVKPNAAILGGALVRMGLQLVWPRAGRGQKMRNGVGSDANTCCPLSPPQEHIAVNISAIHPLLHKCWLHKRLHVVLSWGPVRSQARGLLCYQSHLTGTKGALTRPFRELLEFPFVICARHSEGSNAASWPISIPPGAMCKLYTFLIFFPEQEGFY